jgi:hypothetical protein
MGHPLQNIIRAIATRTWWLTLLWNVARCLSLVLLTGLFVGGVDYGLRIQDAGLRWILAGCFWTTLAWGCWQFLLPAIRHRYSDLYVAQHIERFFPELGQRLSSSIAFLELPAETTEAGSAALRLAVIESTSQEIDGLDLGQCVKSEGTWRAMGLMLAVLLLLGACFVLDKSAATQAASRLTRPWNHAPWPRWNQLEFVEPPPLKIATGASFRVRVKDLNHRLPEKVMLQFRALEDEDKQEVAVMEQDGEVAQYRFSNLQRSFRFRIVGGDDDTMLWNYVTVMNPPTVEDLGLDIHAPEYMQWPVERVAGSFRVLQGSRVTLQGQLDRVAARVFLVTEEENRRRRRALLLDADGQRFSLPLDAPFDWTIEDPCRYWIEVEDENQLIGVSQDQWEVRVVTDLAPVVSIDSPPRQHQVLGVGVVFLKVTARDDFGLSNLDLHFLRSDAGEMEEVSVALWRRGDSDDRPASTGFLGPGPVPDKQSVLYRWDLASLQDLQPGNWIEYRLSATDFKGQVTESPTQRLSLISRNELDQKIMRQQAHIISRLEESLRWQRDARRHALEIQLKFQDPGTYQKSDLDHLQSVELNQRQVKEILFGRKDGIPVDVDQLLEVLQNNRVRLPDLSGQLKRLLRTLGRIHEEQLVDIEAQLLFTLKTSRSEHETVVKDLTLGTLEDVQVPVNPAARLAFQRAVQGQQSVIRRLERLLGEVSEQEDYQRFAYDIRRMANLQDQYREQTQQLQVDRLGRTTEQLTDKERAQQRQAAERQTELARQFEGVLNRMLPMQQRLEERDPVSAGVLSEAINIAQQQALSGQMRESGRDIERNQLGNALAIQLEVHEGLLSMLSILSNRHEHRLDRMLEQLQEAARGLEKARVGQQDLGRQLEAAAQQPQASARKKAFAKLAENQQRLGQQVSSLVTKLRQLGAQRSADGVQSAGEQMDLTAEAIRQDLGKQAVAGSQLSEQKLAAAQQQLLRDIFQVEHGLLRQQLDRLKEQLVTMLQQQQEILAETSALDTLRIVDPQRRLTRVQRGVLKRLAERQRQLALDGLTSARLLERSEAFRFGLQAAGRKMTRAADDLAAELTDKQNAQTAQLQVVAQLQRLLQALQTKVDTGETQGAEPQATTDQQRPGAASPRSLSELILLELMQRNINQQTEELAKARMAAGTWTKKQQLQYAELARQQGQLAAIVDRLRGAAVQPAKESKDE